MAAHGPSENFRRDENDQSNLNSGALPGSLRVNRSSHGPTEIGLVSPTPAEANAFCSAAGVELDAELLRELCYCAARGKALELHYLFPDERAMHEYTVREEHELEIDETGVIELRTFVVEPFADERASQCDVFAPETRISGPVLRFAPDLENSGFVIEQSWVDSKDYLDAEAARSRWERADELIAAIQTDRLPSTLSDFVSGEAGRNSAELRFGKFKLVTASVLPGDWSEYDMPDMPPRSDGALSRGEDRRCDNPSGTKLEIAACMAGLRGSVELFAHLLEVCRGTQHLSADRCAELAVNGRPIGVQGRRYHVVEGDEVHNITAVRISDELGKFGHFDLAINPLSIDGQSMAEHLRATMHWYGRDEELNGLPFEAIDRILLSPV